MGDTLSQEEIDNLLKAFNDGDLNADDFSDTKEKQVKNYDFARPSKFSKDHLRTLEIIFENYGRLLIDKFYRHILEKMFRLKLSMRKQIHILSLQMHFLILLF